MPAKRAEVLKLPDQLLVRYFRSGELDAITKVHVADGLVTVRFGRARTDRFRDLGGGLGYVPEAAGD